MSIFKRMSDIIGANVNDMLDKAENPEKMIKQIVREMDEGVRSARRSTAEAMATEKKLKKELDQNKRLAKEWHNKACQAVDAERDDLAKKAIARKKEAESVVASLESQYAQSQQTCANMKRTLSALESRLSEARRRQSMLKVREQAADAQKALAKGASASDIERGLQAFEKFDEMERRVEDKEMEAEAMVELAGEQAALEELTETTDVDIELEKLKKERKKGEEGGK